MRLARYKRSPEGNRLLVGEDPPPAYGLAPDRDLAQLYAETYERLHGPLRDHAERLLSKDDARDAVGDAMADLWYQWATLSHEKRTDAYVFGIVSHHISRKRRENNRLVTLEDAEAELDHMATRSVIDAARGGEAAEVLDAALAAMTARRREVFLLVVEQGFRYREAAEILGIRWGTIKAHMYVAVEELRAAFARAGFRITSAQHRQLPSPKGGDTND
jgi:RNA polymerase sigma factor (sigma-70 family)